MIDNTLPNVPGGYPGISTTLTLNNTNFSQTFLVNCGVGGATTGRGGAGGSFTVNPYAPNGVVGVSGQTGLLSPAPNSYASNGLTFLYGRGGVGTLYQSTTCIAGGMGVVLVTYYY